MLFSCPLTDARVNCGNCIERTVFDARDGGGRDFFAGGVGIS